MIFVRFVVYLFICIFSSKLILYYIVYSFLSKDIKEILHLFTHSFVRTTAIQFDMNRYYIALNT